MNKYNIYQKGYSGYAGLFLHNWFLVKTIGAKSPDDALKKCGIKKPVFIHDDHEDPYWGKDRESAADWKLEGLDKEGKPLYSEWFYYGKTEEIE